MKNIIKRKIGIAGCGTMGLPMLKVLLKKQISATGYDIKPKENFKSFLTSSCCAQHSFGLEQATKTIANNNINILFIIIL